MALDENRKIEVHVGTFCFCRSKGELKLLILERTPQRRLFPGMWECGGGQVSPGESFKDAVKRQTKEEMGLSVIVDHAIGDYAIDAPSTSQKIIPGVRFVCHVMESEPEVTISGEHLSYRWVTHKQLDELKLKFIPGFREQIEEAFKFINLLKIF